MREAPRAPSDDAPGAMLSLDCPFLRVPALQLLVLIFNPSCDFPPKIQALKKAASDFCVFFLPRDHAILCLATVLLTLEAHEVLIIPHFQHIELHITS